MVLKKNKTIVLGILLKDKSLPKINYNPDNRGNISLGLSLCVRNIFFFDIYVYVECL